MDFMVDGLVDGRTVPLIENAMTHLKIRGVACNNDCAIAALRKGRPKTRSLVLSIRIKDFCPRQTVFVGDYEVACSCSLFVCRRLKPSHIFGTRLQNLMKLCWCCL